MCLSRRWILGMLALSMAAGSCFGEDPGPAKFYKLELVVKEIGGGKVLNSRTYTTVASTSSKSEIRAGSKIPYSDTNTSFQMIDVGVNIDVWAVKEVGDRLSFSIAAEISSVAEGVTDKMRPTIRQNRWTSTLVVPLKKPTLLFSSDNVDAKTQMQIELTATPLPLT